MKSFSLHPLHFILDNIGAGTVGYSRAIADRGFLVYAVEPSQVMRQAIPHPQVQWINGCATSYSPTKSFFRCSLQYFSYASFL